MAKQKTIITCAITGAIQTPTMSDALPYTADDIAHQAMEAAEAGASILHLHSRNPETGAVSIDPDDFATFLPRIKQATDAVVNISTGGSLKTSIEDRIAPAQRCSSEMCSLNMGSMNFSFHPLAKRYGLEDSLFISRGGLGALNSNMRSTTVILDRYWYIDLTFWAPSCVLLFRRNN